MLVSGNLVSIQESAGGVDGTQYAYSKARAAGGRPRARASAFTVIFDQVKRSYSRPATWYPEVVRVPARSRELQSWHSPNRRPLRGWVYEVIFAVRFFAEVLLRLSLFGLILVYPRWVVSGTRQVGSELGKFLVKY